MSQWEGANVTKRNKVSRRRGGSVGSGETVEAALNRLSRAYQTSMECVRAWHRASSSSNSRSATELRDTLMVQLGRNTRKSFEEAILWDPLIRNHSKHLEAEATTTTLELQNRHRPPPPMLTSAGHIATVQQLAYLALLNYADLLLSGCGQRAQYDCSGASSSMCILDKGLVSSLSEFTESSCWEDEGQDVTLKRAMAALMDASELDSTDPILWLKLACCARRLGRCLDGNNNGPPALLRYRRLERHALENGMVALPKNVPPSRLVVKAYEQFEDEQLEDYEFPPVLAPESEEPAQVEIVLAKYSWSALARLMLRACREGSAFSMTRVGGAQQQPPVTGHFSALPVVKIHLSPLLALPSTALARVCDYLGPAQVWRLEATCRGLSYSVISARAITLVQAETAPKGPPPPVQEEKSVDESRGDAGGEDLSSPSSQRQASRASKRLRSQLITSGKRSERSYRRSSVEYCLLATVLGCTPGDKKYQEMLQSDVDWDDGANGQSRRNEGDVRQSSQDKLSRLKDEARERLGDCSLTAFVRSCNETFQEPLSLIFRFVAHASRNIAEVFSSDAGGAMLLSPILLECISPMLSRSHTTSCLVPGWYCGELRFPRSSRLTSLDCFAIDLINCELRLKRFDREDHVDTSYDGDPGCVSIMVPALLRRLEGETAESPEWVKLRIRCHFLAASFYLWRSRTCPVLAFSKDLEDEGLRQIDRAIDLAKRPGCPTVFTPHLESPTRTSPYWKMLSVSTLTSYREEIQAAAVVLVARERFSKAMSTWDRALDPADGISTEDAQVLREIGVGLVGRYLEGDTGRLVELLDDYFEIQADRSKDADSEPAGEVYLPCGRIDSRFLERLPRNPSLLEILSTCIMVDDDRASTLLALYQRIAGAIVASASPSTRQDDPDESDDEDDESQHTQTSRPFGILLEGILRNAKLVLSSGSGDVDVSGLVTTSLAYLSQITWSIDGYRVFRAVRALFRTAHQMNLKGAESAFVFGLIRVIVEQRTTLDSLLKLPGGRQTRALKQKYLENVSNLLASALLEVAKLLSVHANGRAGFTLSKAPILERVTAHEISKMSNALSDLWKTASGDQSQLSILLVPLAAAIVALCGSAIHTRTRGMASDLALDSFYDSDSSAYEIDSWTESSEELLRAVASAIYCTNTVFAKISDSDASSYSKYEGYMTRNGPILPLTIARVLNSFADQLLTAFPVVDEGDGFSFGIRTTGRLLDVNLYKAYKCLHGFTLVNANEIKDVPTSSARVNVTRYLPENVQAAAGLYRCIVRAYGHARRSPPKASLDAVLDVLPPMQENVASRMITHFLYSGEVKLTLEDIVRLVSNVEGWEKQFGSTWKMDLDLLISNSHRVDNGDDEALLIRRGIYKLLANAPLNGAHEGGSDRGDREERKLAMMMEEELVRRFQSIVEANIYGNTSLSQGWFKAAQCVSSKADLIADRLGFSRSNAGADFAFSEAPQVGSCSLEDLKSEQKREAAIVEDCWVSHLGVDLSVYVRTCWSDFGWLQTMKIERGGAEQQRCFDTLTLLQSNNDLSGWQSALGGLFVSGLRQVGLRCVALALATAYRDGVAPILLSEMLESMGVILYNELSGSQVYGFPVHPLPARRKRELAEAAMLCFQRSVQVLAERDEVSTRPTWDLQFMVGKCEEKIASTYTSEAFRADSEFVRRYEYHMSKAMQSYAESLADGLKEEQDGSVVEQNGGSSHGATEVLYRLHASRLKCLVRAVRARENERNAAELEALRLTEANWFKTPENIESSVRSRVWEVLSDCVAALAHCRNEYSFFHRSVFRHAQALMWAPVLFDPVSQRHVGSLGSVPATKAYKLRGLNFATDAANSAMSVIGTLFDKKRTQLCAVWYTQTTSPTPFEVVNSSVRKYDALRGKYISAYVTCLRLCKKRTELETFLRWTIGCARDLPLYFAASAEAQGGVPTKPHTEDCLLVKPESASSFYWTTVAKRLTNSALAATILDEVEEANTNNQVDKESQLKAAYACFLRLNCQPIDLIKSSSWKYPRSNPKSVEGGTKDIVDSLTGAYLRLFKDEPIELGSDWSGESHAARLLQRALAKSKELFPNLSGNFYSKKKKTPQKKKRDEPTTATVKKSFDVKVPGGLKPGDTFVVSIHVDGKQKKVRLTVPAEPAEVMRFNLEVAAGEEASPPAKQLKTDEPTQDGPTTGQSEE